MSAPPSQHRPLLLASGKRLSDASDRSHASDATLVAAGASGAAAYGAAASASSSAAPRTSNSNTAGEYTPRPIRLARYARRGSSAGAGALEHQHQYQYVYDDDEDEFGADAPLGRGKGAALFDADDEDEHEYERAAWGSSPRRGSQSQGTRKRQGQSTGWLTAIRQAFFPASPSASAARTAAGRQHRSRRVQSQTRRSASASSSESEASSAPYRDDEIEDEDDGACCAHCGRASGVDVGAGAGADAAADEKHAQAQPHTPARRMPFRHSSSSYVGQHGAAHTVIDVDTPAGGAAADGQRRASPRRGGLRLARRGLRRRARGRKGGDGARGGRGGSDGGESAWSAAVDLLLVLVPTVAACALSFVLGVSFEMLRSSILDAKGGHAHRAHPHSGYGYWRNRLAGAAGAGSGSGMPAGLGGCSASELALAHVSPVGTLRIHSHNDETRDKPLLEALSYGAISVEADVWRVDNSSTVYVGHELESLADRYTFRSLYVDPLVTILEQRNSRANATGSGSGSSDHSGSANAAGSNATWRGVYESAPAQTLYLFLDIKSDSLQTWASVSAALEPLRARGWLTRWEDGARLVPGAVTVIGTGDAPVELVATQRTRDMFVDAPVGALDTPIRGVDAETYAYNATLSPIASGNWLTSIGYLGLLPASAGTRAKVRKLSDAAHARGMHVRWWNNPAWPRFARDRAWRLMLDEKADLLNADNLEGAADVLFDGGYESQLRPLSTLRKR